MKDISNIAHYIPALAERLQNKTAIKYLKNNQYVDCTFVDFHLRSNQIANGLRKHHLKKGDRVIMMVKHTLEFYLVTFALFKIGAVPVIVDPGMRKKDLLKCIKKANAKALIGIPLAHLIKMFFKSAFQSIELQVTVGKKFFWKGPTLNDFYEEGNKKDILESTNREDLAAILFTSGSTGVPKGVEYEHGIFGDQVKSIQSIYHLNDQELDMPCFPLFGLFSLAMGITLVLPDMDPSKPASVDPLKIIQPIQKFGITNCFASPAVWDKLSAYCEKNNIKLPTLKKALAAGAPVAGHIVQRLIQKVLPDDGDLYTPYGATESLPVASINGRFILEKTQSLTNKGKGTCVGKPVEGVEVNIIKIIDEPIKSLSKELILNLNEIGEIIVHSTMITKKYFDDQEKTANAKIRDEGKVWHRIGDVGYLDDEGYLWFCGRKDHRVELENETLFTIPCEAIFNNHKDVFRTALVGVLDSSNQLEPVIIIETLLDSWTTNKVVQKKISHEVLRLGQEHKHTVSIKKCIFYKSLPVDVRHNAKINRELLSQWANQQNNFYEFEL